MIATNEEEVRRLKEIGKIVGAIRDEMILQTKAGMTTKELDTYGKSLFEKYNATSAPISEYNFPGYTCISINEEVAHGIPGDRIIKDGDLVNIDVSGCKNGFFADTGKSFIVGKSGEVQKNLCIAMEETYEAGLKKIKVGGKINGLSKAVQRTAKQHGFKVIRNLTGHGIGTSLHEYPDHILNYFDPWDNRLFQEGMVIAFEPFLSTKAEYIVEKGDGWTFITEDNSFVVQKEHTILITKEGPEILT
ncbi:type I methionyl aminopeptidase [Bacillus carboniphilus]|uniref:Methionine aminopeptidase n=1 Tax=Bacillus carboniphilus TaxID=86663 RepID=A0ABY9JZJ6_9BACI|nr:type I methionyl aminopeptidase [Bacillus carboniphilus]WLR43025.1 type I methionyl aminopeptidase [Bacillus carboniphilus]